MPTPLTRCTRIAAIVAAVALTGCSALVARKPGRDWKASEAPKCGTSKGTVGLDATMAVVIGLVGLVAAGADETEVGGLSLVGGVAYAVSAGYGNHAANRCRAAHAAHDEFLTREEDAPEPTVASTTPPATTPPVAAPRAPAPTPVEAEEQDPEEAEEDAPPDDEPPPSEDEWSAFWVEVFP